MKRLPVVLVLENLRSLHNVGALFRSADATRVESIVICGLTALPPRTEIAKTALGATDTVPWEYCASIREAVATYGRRGYIPYALEQTPEATNIFTTGLHLPALLVVGHEREGVSAEALRACTHHLHIPMHGESAHSLNVSTSATVALYQFAKDFWYD
jgi:23S rRNA (guanosine2251-2'-O)-methyltransferase